MKTNTQRPSNFSSPWMKWIALACIGLMTIPLFAQNHHQEGSISLPDSLSGLLEPQAMVMNTVDQTLFVGGAQGEVVIVIDANSRAKLARIPLGFNVGKLTFNSTHNKVYAAEWGGKRIAILDGATHSLIDTLSLPVNSNEYALAYNPTANKVYVANYRYPSHVFVIDGTNDQLVAQIEVGDLARDLVVDAAANRVYCSVSRDDQVAVIDGGSDTLMYLIGVGDRPAWMTFNPATSKLYCLNTQSDDCSVIDASNGQVLATIPVGENPAAIAYNPTRNEVYVSNANTFPQSLSLSIIDGDGDSLRQNIPTGRHLSTMTYNGDEDKLYLSHVHADDVLVFDPATRAFPDTIVLGESVIGLHYENSTGDWYALNLGTNNVSVVDGSTDLEMARPQLGMRPRKLAYHAGLEKVYVSDDETPQVVVLNAANLQVSSLLQLGDLSSELVYLPAHNRYYAGSSDGLLVINPLNDQVVKTISLPAKPSSMVYASGPDKLYGSHADNFTISVIDAATEQVATTIYTGKKSYRGFYHSGNNQVYFLNAWSDDMTIINCATDQVVATLNLGLDPELWAYNEQTDELFIGKPLADEVVVVDCSNNTVGPAIAVGEGPHHLLYNPDANKIYSANEDEGTVSVIDGNTHAVIKTVPAGTFPYYLAYHPVLQQVFCANWWSSDLTIIDGTADTVVQTVAVGTNPVRMIYNPVAERMFVACLNGSSLSLVKDSTSTASIEDSFTSLAGQLLPNYPNPFADETMVAIRLEQPGDIRLRVFALTGQEKLVVFEGKKPAGQHEFLLQTSHWPSGVYWLGLELNGKNVGRKLVKE
jgi:YVTN family beta-propeller protein